MESSPLVKAHDHARAASTATRTADTTVAIDEHARAAGEFSNAVKTTKSVEALRTLRLLEQHHQRLSELLKYPQENPVQQSSSTDGDDQDAVDKGIGSKAQPEGQYKSKQEINPGGAVSKTATHTAGGPQQRRYPPSRELSSSIASNLASARGIRSKYRGQPLAPSISIDQAPGSMDGHVRKDGSRTQMQSVLHHKGKPSWVPPTQSSPAAEPKHVDIDTLKTEENSSQSDEGFSRFYITFGSLINRLSAPLAFAGLPLIAEEQTSEPTLSPDPSLSKKSRTKGSQMSIPEPDLSRIYSKAALRALSRDGHGTNDSFYVVPKTGHTVSYANILSFDHKQKRRMAASLHGDDDLLDDADDDDFVDAKESQAPLSPAAKKRIGRSRSDKDLQNVIEELYTENQSLKDMLDKLSKRLHAFEANAQNSHMALQESIRFMRPGSPLSSSGSGKGIAGDDVLRKRNKELEEELGRAVKQMERLEKEHGRMERNLDMYRDKWEKLKAGAKARREAQGSTTNAESSKPTS